MKWSTILLLVIVTCIGHQLKAQEFYSPDSAQEVKRETYAKAERGVGVLLNFKLGAAIPFGMFASDNILNSDPLNQPGYAKSAVAFGIELEAHTRNLFLIGFHLDYARFGFNEEPFDMLVQQNPTYTAVKASSWRQIQPMIALGIQHEVGPVGIELKALGGMSWNQSPDLNLEIRYLGNTYNQLQMSTNVISPCFGGGFAMRYHFNKVFVKTFTEFVLTSGEFYTETYVSGLGQNFSVYETYTYEMNSFRSGIVLGIKF